VEDGGQLPVRLTAGASGLVNGYLSPDQRGLYRTGNDTMLGSSQWVEILRADGRTGWVQASSLTEYVSAEQFCADARANGIVSSFAQALADRDGDQLASLVNEAHGFFIRVDWWNPAVSFTKGQVADLFADPSTIEWGKHFASNTQISGSFADIILPQLDDVFAAEPALTCDELQVGSVAQDIHRPVAYANLNFYNYYRPAPEGGNEFNWRSWTILIEYVEGQPYLVGLVQYRPQV
jgi:hypothetical protein